MEAASSTGGPSPHHRKTRGAELPQGPAAVQITQQIQLPSKGAAAWIAAGVVVAEDAGERQIQLRQARRDTGLAIAEVTHHQQRIGCKLLEELLINAVPLPMQISGDGDAELCQTDA